MTHLIKPVFVIALTLLCLMRFGIGPAAAKSGYGEKVDNFCRPADGSTPFQALGGNAGGGCLLCHNTTGGSGAKGNTWTWYQNGNYSLFCNGAPANRAPNGTIAAPSADQRIAVGATMTFQGTGTDPDGDVLTYNWNFGISTATGPGPHVVAYPNPGTYQIILTVSDGRLSDPTPATRVITVGASCTDADGDGVCAPQDCDDANPAVHPNAVEICGDGIDNNCDGLDTACTVACRDADGDGYSPQGGVCGPEDCDDRDALVNPGRREICDDGLDNDCDDYLDDTDRECNGKDCLERLFPVPNQAPTCVIDTPTGDQTIDAGQTLSFAGTGMDADGDQPLIYAWDFGGGASGSNVEDPGSITFTRAGRYPVSFRVTDSRGLACTPATLTITVREHEDGTPFSAHPISADYVREGHKKDWKRRPDECRSCHGADFRGTASSATFEARVWPSDRRQPDGSKLKRYAQGEWVGCLECHSMSDDDDDDDRDRDRDRDREDDR